MLFGTSGFAWRESFNVRSVHNGMTTDLNASDTTFLDEFRDSLSRDLSQACRFYLRNPFSWVNQVLVKIG